ncbi:DUF3224 domain-containing protein [Streptomyces sp. RS10V-4]|uniref:DUF3224 domain-containing protein n=1 Tax=Streptomyces rhizoryzae TaxID=2932493 RepID=UPI002003BA19|nr:DUF3224 domain-containing protein [Streptomyces rhizoryzae]MCK7622470.1 DUF3224 domain-containing protein [Streptomyces rhizoryzae]
MPAQTTGRITYTNWEESKAGPDGTHPRLARACVTNSFAGGIEAAGTTCEYTLVYTGDTTGTFTGLELLAGRQDGRAGSFVIEQHGTFGADGTVRCAFEVVPGTGTGELAGLSGSGTFTHRAGEPSFPYTFDYRLG